MACDSVDRDPPNMTKTASFAVVHFAVAFSVGFVLTGDVLVGGLIALVEPFVNTIAYHLHERFWVHRKTLRAPAIRGSIEQVA
jgi:uncharacterized membrane protein